MSVVYIAEHVDTECGTHVDKTTATCVAHMPSDYRPDWNFPRIHASLLDGPRTARGSPADSESRAISASSACPQRVSGLWGSPPCGLRSRLG
jgi:hypothetical protein